MRMTPSDVLLGLVLLVAGSLITVLAGVAGTRLQAKRETRTYWLEARRAEYSRFLTEAYDTYAALWTLVDYLRETHEIVDGVIVDVHVRRSVSDAFLELQMRMNHLIERQNVVYMISSPSVVEAAAKVMWMLALGLSGLEEDDLDVRRWANLDGAENVSQWPEVRDKFLNAARLEVGHAALKMTPNMVDFEWYQRSRWAEVLAVLTDFQIHARQTSWPRRPLGDDHLTGRVNARWGGPQVGYREPTNESTA